MAIDKSQFIGTFVTEAREHLGNLNNGLLALEKSSEDMDTINSIFRSAHTIKGSAGMLDLKEIQGVAHKLEDALDAVRSKKLTMTKALSDLFFKGIDSITELVDLAEINPDIALDTSEICNQLEKAVESAGEDPKEEPTVQKDESVEKPAEESSASGYVDDISADPAIIASFCEDTLEVFQSLENDISTLEEEPENSEIINNIFRGMHSIKGGASFLNLPLVMKLSHSLENLMNKVRDGSLCVDSAIVDLLFEGLDMLKDMLNSLVEGVSSTVNIDEILIQVGDYLDGNGKKTVAKPTVKPVDQTAKKLKAQTKPSSSSKPKPKADETIRISSMKLDEVIKLMGEMVSCQSRMKLRLNDVKRLHRESEKSLKIISRLSAINEKMTNLISRNEAELQGSKIGAIAEKSGLIDKEVVTEVLRRQEESFGVKRFGEIAQELGYLSDDDISDLISKQNEVLKDVTIPGTELAKISLITQELTKATESLCLELKQFMGASKDDTTAQEMLTAELQGKALNMRMLPLSTVFDTFRRSVRDIAKSQGKDIEFSISGSETELDKKMIEMIGDPLTHMLRNSIGHGIENPEDRVKAGKPEKGTMELSAYYEAGNVVIKIADDGAGISAEKILEKAREKELMSEESLNALTETEIIDLIYHPGFSTKEVADSISGRGVGMDVVKKNIVESLKGTIKTVTKVGEGTTFFIYLPLTLAIMRVMTVSASGLTLGVPLNYISEVKKVAISDVVEVVNKPAIRLEDELVPLVYIDSVLGLPNIKHKHKTHLTLVVASVGGEKLGLVVDFIIEEEDTVIKPLPGHMKNIKWVAGVMLDGKGEMINVLHIPALFNTAKNVKIDLNMESNEDDDSIRILLVDDSVITRSVEKDMLESNGFLVEEAENGVKGLEMLKKKTYDLIITDIEMPEMDGFTFIEEIRKQEHLKYIPVVISSTLEQERHKKRGIEAGASAYIVKQDFDNRTVLDTIQNLVV